MAEKLHITQAGYGNYETGRTEPDINTLKKISEILGASIDSLVENTEKHNTIELLELTSVKREAINEILQMNDEKVEDLTKYIYLLKTPTLKGQLMSTIAELNWEELYAIENCLYEIKHPLR